MSINEIKNFMFENYYKTFQLLFNKTFEKKIFLGKKLIKNVPDPRNAKEHYQSFIIKKNRKSVKKIRKNYLSLTLLVKKSVITEHPKTSHKLSKTIRQAENIGPNSSLYKDTKKSHLLNEINLKIAKREHAFKGYASTIMLKF